MKLSERERKTRMGCCDRVSITKMSTNLYASFASSCETEHGRSIDGFEMN